MERREVENGKLKVKNLPDGWKKIRLKFLLKERMQYGAISSGIPFNPELPRYIRITNIKDIKNLFDDDKISLSEEESKDFLLEDGDILFARSGATAGKCFMYRKEIGKAGYAGVTSPDYRVFQLHNQNENCSRYYLYMMQMCYMDKIFYGLGQGVSGMGRWRLQADKFLNILITVPPKNEQSEIAVYLDKKCSQIDTVIAQKEQFITEMEKYKQSLIYEYVTGKKQVSSCEFSNENSGKREV